MLLKYLLPSINLLLVISEIKDHGINKFYTNLFIRLYVTVSQEAYSMNKYGVGILAAVMIAALVMPAVAAGQATVDRTSFINPQYNRISGYVHDWTGAPVESATVVLVFYGDWRNDIYIGDIEIATAITDVNGSYDFGYSVYAYQFSPALVFSYALGCEPSSPQIIFLSENYYFNIVMYNLTTPTV